MTFGEQYPVVKQQGLRSLRQGLKKYASINFFEKAIALFVYLLLQLLGSNLR